jgi:hypothetical protein
MRRSNSELGQKRHPIYLTIRSAEGAERLFLDRCCGLRLDLDLDVLPVVREIATS